MDRLRTILRGLFPVLLSISAYAQNQYSDAKKFLKAGDIFGTRNFIENKGQFENPLNADDKVLFRYQHCGENFYFTAKGVVYELIGPDPQIEEENEEEGKGEEKVPSPAKRYYVQMTWTNTNQDLEVTGAEKQTHYFTYGPKELNSYAYQKILYRNIYKNIDLEYCIPADKNYGIKYSFTLHPGASLADIQMIYSGKMKKLVLQKTGDLIIKTPLEDIVEHAPASFYQDGEPLASAFKINGNKVTFDVPGYVPGKEMIIDPWITAITTLTNNNAGHDVDYDFFGNAYVYGASPNTTNGQSKAAKFSSSGVLLWTFSGIITTPSWSSNFGWHCGMAADKSFGKMYVSRRLANGTNNVVRLDASGNYDNWISSGTQLGSEIGDIEFTCGGDLMVFGGNTGSGEIISASTGSVTLFTTFHPNLGSACCQDVISHAIDITGNIFVTFGTPSSIANQISRVATSFTASSWTQPSGYTSWGASSANSNALGGGGGIVGNENKALAVNNNYLFHYNGYDLSAYNKATGTLIAATTCTGQTLKVQSGIAVDECDNIYVGGNGQIRCFNFNGTSFSTLTTISLNSPTTITNQYIFDVVLNRFTKELFVSGSGLIGNYSAIHSLSCAPLYTPNICYFGQWYVGATSTSVTCANLGSGTVTPIGGIGPYTYTWLPTLNTNSVASNLSPGTYTILVHDAGTNFTFTNTVIFFPLVPLTGGVISSGAVPCFGASTATAGIINLAGGSGNQSYSWTNGTTVQTTSVATGLNAGTWTVTVTDALTGCVITPTFAILSPSQLNSLLGSSSPSACAGNSIMLNVLNFGGTPPYTNLWTGGPATATNLVTQNIGGAYHYTVTSYDAYSCPHQAVATLTFVPIPIVAVSNQSICPLETATLNASGAASYTWNTGNTNSSFTASPLSTTFYTVSGQALGCSSTSTAAIILKAVPVPLIGSNSPRCENSQLQLFATGGSNYKWNGPLSYLSFLQNPAINTVSLSQAGVYNLTVTAVNSCTAATSLTVVVNLNPTLTASGATVCTSQTLNLSSNAILGLTFTWQGPSGFSSNVQNPSLNNPLPNSSGNYTVTATSGQGCSTSTSIPALVLLPPTLSAPLSSQTLCAQPLNGSPNSITLTTQGANSYTLITPVNIFNNSVNPPYQLNAVPPYQSGISVASLILQGSNGICVSTLAVSFGVIPNPVVSLIIPNPVICAGESFTYNSSGASTYTWGPVSPVITVYGSGGTAVVHPNISSLFTVVGSSLGCSSAALNTNILVHPIPTVSVTPQYTSVCLGKAAELIAYGTATSFTWTPPNGLNSISGATVYAKPLIDQAYIVTGIANNCTNTAVANITVLALPKPTAIVSNPSVCLNQTVSLTGNGGVGYRWDGPDMISFAGKTATFVAWNIAYAGTYTLTVTDKNGCVNSTLTSISIKELPQGALIGTKMQACVPFCSDFTFSSTSGTNVSTTWKVERDNFNSKTFTYCFTKAKEYFISGIYIDQLTGCANTQSFMVKGLPVPAADFNWLPEKPVEKMDEVFFVNSSAGENINQWTWFFVNDKGLSSKNENLTYLFEDAGIYPIALIIKNSYGCSDSVVKVITVEPDFLCFVPNAFTPNEDNMNEVFLPVLRGISRYSFSIFDRWGELIFSTSDPAQGWNGYFKDKPCKQDVYVYKISLHTTKGEAKELRGQITLYR